VDGSESWRPRTKLGIEAGWMGWTAIKSASFYTLDCIFSSVVNLPHEFIHIPEQGVGGRNERTYLSIIMTQCCTKCRTNNSTMRWTWEDTYPNIMGNLNSGVLVTLRPF